MKPRIATVVVAAALLVGCTSEASDEAADTTALCSGYERRHELAQELLAPGVFDLSADELERIFDRLNELSAAMARAADGMARELLEQGLRFRTDADEIVLDRWREDLDALRQVGDGWTVTALEGHDELVADDGSTIATSDWLGGRAQTTELLYATCEEPELIDGPAEDLTESPPSGIVSYFRFTDIRTATGERLAVTTAGDESDVRFELPVGWRAPLYGDAAGDRVVLSAEHDGRIGLLSYDAGGEPEIAYDGSESLTCASLSPGQSTILATGQRAEGPVVEVQAGLADDLGLDLPVQGCAAEIGGDRLLVGPAATDRSDPPGAAVMASDGSDFDTLELPPHCAAVVGDVDESQQHAALALRCGTPGDSGLWTVDLDTLDVEHVVTGLVGTPKFSPDGNWLTFGFAPLGASPSEVAIWLAKADGTGARELVERGANPLWLDAR